MEKLGRQVETKLIGDGIRVDDDPYRPFAAPGDIIRSLRRNVTAHHHPPLQIAPNRVHIEVVQGVRSEELEIRGFPIFVHDSSPGPRCELSLVSNGLVAGVASDLYTRAKTLNGVCPPGMNLAFAGVVDGNPSNPSESYDLQPDHVCPFYCPDPSSQANNEYDGTDRLHWSAMSCLVPVGYDPAADLGGDKSRCSSSDKSKTGQVFPEAISTFMLTPDIAEADCQAVCSTLNRRYHELNKCAHPMDKVASPGNCICGPSAAFEFGRPMMSARYTNSTRWPLQQHKCETDLNLVDAGFVDQNPFAPWSPTRTRCPFYCPDVSDSRNKNYGGTDRQMWPTLSCLIAVGCDPAQGMNKTSPSECKRNVGRSGDFYGQLFPTPVTHLQFASIDDVDCEGTCRDIGRSYTSKNFCKESGSKYGNCFCGPNFDGALQFQVALTALATATTVGASEATFFESFNQSFGQCHGEGVVYEQSGLALNKQVCTVAAWGRRERQHVACYANRTKTRVLVNDTHTSFACRGLKNYAHNGVAEARPEVALFPRQPGPSSIPWPYQGSASTVFRTGPELAQNMAINSAPASITIATGVPVAQTLQQTPPTYVNVDPGLQLANSGRIKLAAITPPPDAPRSLVNVYVRDRMYFLERTVRDMMPRSILSRRIGFTGVLEGLGYGDVAFQKHMYGWVSSNGSYSVVDASATGARRDARTINEALEYPRVVPNWCSTGWLYVSVRVPPDC